MKLKPRLFVGSSVESIAVAYAVQEELDHSTEVTVWSQGIFSPSITTMTSLLNALVSFDAALFVFAPDDELRMRGSSVGVARDNVIFEFGLFVGGLGLDRVFFLVPRDTNIHLPTDLLAVAPLTYDPNRTDGNVRSAVGPACNQVRNSIARAGARTPRGAAGTRAPLLDDSGCTAILRSWLDREIIDVLLRPVEPEALEADLRLPPGCVVRLIGGAVAASDRNLVVAVATPALLQLSERK